MSTPEPKMKGRYNLYDTPDGGIHIAYTVEGDDEIQHLDIPGQVVRAARMMEQGKMNPMQAVKLLMGH